MANPYCSVAQLQVLYDMRVIGMLSNDANQSALNTSNIQLLLDMQASELESSIDGRWSLAAVQANPPMVLTKWVGATTMQRLYARRNDEPKEVAADAAWAKEWIELLREGKVDLPSLSRGTQPYQISGGGPSITCGIPYLGN